MASDPQRRTEPYTLSREDAYFCFMARDTWVVHNAFPYMAFRICDLLVFQADGRYRRTVPTGIPVWEVPHPSRPSVLRASQDTPLSPPLNTTRFVRTRFRWRDAAVYVSDRYIDMVREAHVVNLVRTFD